MKKKTILQIYRFSFLIAIVLYLVTVSRFITSSEKQWFPPFMSLGVMFLSLWGYFIIKNYFK